ncbi:hypothetical protein QQ020_01410 [Fulvivirgaceae bacterium BMA12]|uniref:tRNA (Guanine-N1)-methyltransferase n=1 Tax=Agaribacillus aureus TaxID=3051825 RepID=A0ABT8KZ07_9BACT|nr:hypothetical protein [Fulvivirgaceae bacterium BMA12]
MRFSSTLYSVGLCTIFFIVIATSTLHAQTTEKTPLDSGTLSQQFEYVKKKSSSYNDFKVIKLSRLDKMWSNALDSLSATRSSLAEFQKKVGTQQTTIDGLNKSLEDTKQQLAEVTEEKDSISLLGIGMAKKNYHGLMWFLVFALLAMLGVAIYKFKDSNKITVNAERDFRNVSEEYEEFKKKSLEKERKLKRELQTEINRVEDLKRRINS